MKSIQLFIYTKIIIIITTHTKYFELQKQCNRATTTILHELVFNACVDASLHANRRMCIMLRLISIINILCLIPH